MPANAATSPPRRGALAVLVVCTAIALALAGTWSIAPEQLTWEHWTNRSDESPALVVDLDGIAPADVVDVNVWLYLDMDGPDQDLVTVMVETVNPPPADGPLPHLYVRGPLAEHLAKCKPLRLLGATAETANGRPLVPYEDMPAVVRDSMSPSWGRTFGTADIPAIIDGYAVSCFGLGSVLRTRSDDGIVLSMPEALVVRTPDTGSADGRPCPPVTFERRADVHHGPDSAFVRGTGIPEPNSRGSGDTLTEVGSDRNFKYACVSEVDAGYLIYDTQNESRWRTVRAVVAGAVLAWAVGLGIWAVRRSTPRT